MASVSSAPAPGMQQIDLSKLAVPQLAQLKQQLDQEINVIQESLQTLKMAQNKFHESEQSVFKITSSDKGATILVPLTGSMYVPGTIADTDHVLIDIGTGYYAQMDLKSGKEYFERKVAFVTEQMLKIQNVGREKANIQDTICQLLGSKIQAQRSATTSS